MHTKLVIRLDNNELMADEHLDGARAFGVELGDPKDPVTTQAYVVAYFRHLICQREKLDRGLLVDHVKPAIAEMWQKILASLEEGNRRVMDAGHGSLTLTLFCPTTESAEHLQDLEWKKSVSARLEEFLKLIGNNYFRKF